MEAEAPRRSLASSSSLPSALRSLLPLLRSASSREKFHGLLRCSVLFAPASSPSSGSASSSSSSLPGKDVNATAECPLTSEAIAAVILAVRPSFLRQVLLSSPVFCSYALQLLHAFTHVDARLTARLLRPCFSTLCFLLLREGQLTHESEAQAAQTPQSTAQASANADKCETKTRESGDGGNPGGQGDACDPRSWRQSQARDDDEDVPLLSDVFTVTRRFALILGRRTLLRALSEAAEKLYSGDDDGEEEARFHRQFEAALDEMDKELDRLKSKHAQPALSDAPAASVAAPAGRPEAEARDDEEDEQELDEAGLQLNRVWEEKEFGDVVSPYASDDEDGDDEEDERGADEEAAVQGLFFAAVLKAVEADEGALAARNLTAQLPQKIAGGEGGRQSEASKNAASRVSNPEEKSDGTDVVLVSEAAFSLGDVLLPCLERAPRTAYLALLFKLVSTQRNALTLLAQEHLSRWLDATALLAEDGEEGARSPLWSATADKRERGSDLESTRRRRRGAEACLKEFQKEKMELVAEKVAEILSGKLPWKARAGAFDVARSLLQLFGLSWAVPEKSRVLLKLATRLSAVEIRLYFDDVLNALTDERKPLDSDGLSSSSSSSNAPSASSASSSAVAASAPPAPSLPWFLSQEARGDRAHLITASCAFMSAAFKVFSQEIDFLEKHMAADVHGLVESIHVAMEAIFDFVEELQRRPELASRMQAELAAAARLCGAWLAGEPSKYGDSFVRSLPVFCRHLPPALAAPLLPALLSFNSSDWALSTGVVELLGGLFLFPGVAPRPDQRTAFFEIHTLVASLLSSAALDPLVSPFGRRKDNEDTAAALAAWLASLRPALAAQISLPADGLSPDQLHAPSGSFNVSGGLEPEAFDTLSLSKEPRLRKSAGDPALFVLTGMLSYATFCLGVCAPRPPPAEPQASAAAAPEASAIQQAPPCAAQSASAASSSRGSPFPSAALVAEWWPPMRAALMLSVPEQVARQLESKFAPFAEWPGDAQAPLKTFYLWRCEVVSTAAALVGLRCTQQALLELLEPREILDVWGALVRQWIILTPRRSELLARVERPEVALWYRSLRVLAACGTQHPFLSWTLHKQLTDYQHVTNQPAKNLVPPPPPVEPADEEDWTDYSESDALLVKRMRMYLLSPATFG
ncbi:hypothetical protein BESB_039590 [Besnoitia besnoiti]|uniref:Uncharacterized protein n=1 Tax=Besnoitia besnoiti TaxID=94643 RepID=A0A2A9MM79_BESBE|nr:hypothetical protein BESB_039590 [Besnoitia besnoiti]PFH37501.1 hypothetical protein BESB_039590 [Besnoitia besnoiti]